MRVERRIFTAVAAIGLTLAGPTLAETTPAATTTETQPLTEKKTCKTYVQIGSRLGGKKVCRTKAEWAEAARLARDEVEEQQTRRQWNPSGS